MVTAIDMDIEALLTRLDHYMEACHFWFGEAQEAFKEKDFRRHAEARASHALAAAFYHASLDENKLCS